MPTEHSASLTAPVRFSSAANNGTMTLLSRGKRICFMITFPASCTKCTKHHTSTRESSVECTCLNHDPPSSAWTFFLPVTSSCFRTEIVIKNQRWLHLDGWINCQITKRGWRQGKGGWVLKSMQCCIPSYSYEHLQVNHEPFSGTKVPASAAINLHTAFNQHHLMRRSSAVCHSQGLQCTGTRRRSLTNLD